MAACLLRSAAGMMPNSNSHPTCCGAAGEAHQPVCTLLTVYVERLRRLVSDKVVKHGAGPSSSSDGEIAHVDECRIARVACRKRIHKGPARRPAAGEALPWRRAAYGRLRTRRRREQRQKRSEELEKSMVTSRPLSGKDSGRAHFQRPRKKASRLYSTRMVSSRCISAG